MTPAQSVAQDISQDQSICPEAPPYDKGRKIETSRGMDMKKFQATMKLPPGYKFVDTEDARYFLRNWQKLPPCDLKPLVGLIVPENGWGDPDWWNSADKWQIEVYYDPGFVSIEDVISAKYDEMVQQVRESYFEKQRGYSQYDLRDYRTVVGWATPPGYIREIDTMIWSLHLTMGNDHDYAVPIKAVKLGRYGRFRFDMTSMYQQHQADRMVLIKAANSIVFDKGFSLDDRNHGKDPAPVATIGQLVAEDVKAEIAPPITWLEYGRALKRWITKLITFYAIEMLAMFTVAIIGLMLLFLRARIGHFSGANQSSNHDMYIDEPCQSNSVPRLNGVPLSRF